MIIKGKIHKFGNDVNTDEIIPARYLNTSDLEVLAAHVMEDADPAFSGVVKSGDIMVAGKNFGCGSSREHAPLAIRTAGISCIVAESYARIFYRNAFNIGLTIVEAPVAAEAETGHILQVDTTSGIIVNVTIGKEYTSKPIPVFMRELLAAGGLMEYVRKGQ